MLRVVCFKAKNVGHPIIIELKEQLLFSLLEWD